MPQLEFDYPYKTGVLMRSRACFFAWVRDKSAFRIAEWYENDRKILEDLGFDVVVANSPQSIPLNCDLYFAWWWNLSLPSLIVSRIGKRPHIVAGNVKEISHRIAGKGNTVRESLERASSKLVLGFSDAVLATSKCEYDVLASRGVKRLHLVHHGIDTDVYSPGHDTSRDPCKILTVTHLAYGNIVRKCIPQIIHAASLVVNEVPETKFVIAGGGNEAGFDELTRLVNQMGLQNTITLTGRITKADKLRLYRESSIYLQPTRWEGFGLAIAEAMSCGLPIVTSPAGAVPEVVGDAGLFSSADNAEELSEQICRLLTDASLRTQLGQSGRRRVVDNFSYERRKERLATLIERLL